MKSAWDIDPSLGERLIAWRTQGISFADIASRLGKTRNSCIGWARRQGLANPAVRAARDPKPEPPPEPEPMPEPVPTNPIRLLDTLNTIRECRWPLWGNGDEWGDAPSGDFLVCGAPTVEGTSWCKRHRRLAFSPHQPKKQEAA